MSAGFSRHAAGELPLIAVIPTSTGLAVRAAGHSRILPWTIVGSLLDDPTISVVACGTDELGIRDLDRLLCALASDDAHAQALITGTLDQAAVRHLRRHPRRWARTIDSEILIGHLDAACCRAGLALPGGDPLRRVAAMATLAARHDAQLEVRARLQHDHPWIGDDAWLAATGLLAELVVLQGLRRNQAMPEIVPGALTVRELLPDAEALIAGCLPEVQAAQRALLDGHVRWNERSHLHLESADGFRFMIAGVEVTLGVGGLHSLDIPGPVAGPLVDLDVASYYPSIIARDGISPAHLPDFSERVRTLMQRRLAAKRAGDVTASTALKFVINSLYGQLGNPRSALCSPADALRVVLTGQLSLLALIDRCVRAGCALVSANTDGVVIRGDPHAAATAWETQTGLTLERTPYQRLWRTSVNDYLALAQDGTIAKARGRFAGGDADDGGSRRSSAGVVAKAVAEHLMHQRSLSDVIERTTSVADFSLWRHARDLQWNGVPVTDSVVRWVVGRSGTPLVQITNRGQTTVAAHALPVPDPATFDLGAIDRSWYVRAAQDLVDQVLGTAGGARQLSWLDATTTDEN